MLREQLHSDKSEAEKRKNKRNDSTNEHIRSWKETITQVIRMLRDRTDLEAKMTRRTPTTIFAAGTRIGSEAEELRPKKKKKKRMNERMIHECYVVIRKTRAWFMSSISEILPAVTRFGKR